MRQPANRWASIGCIAFAGALLATGCFGGIDGMGTDVADDTTGDGDDLPPDDVPLDPGVQAQYEAEVDPILRANCIGCHGPDEGHREAGLRLDLFEDATKPHKNGTPIVPGKPEQSALIQRITTDDPEGVGAMIARF